MVDTPCNDCCPVAELSVVVRDDIESATFTPYLYGGVPPIRGDWVMVANQTLELLAYKPATGVLFVGIEIDQTGVVSYHVGPEFASPALANETVIPVPDVDHYTVAFVRLYESQVALTNEDIRPPAQIMLNYASLETGYQIHQAEEKTALDADDELGIWNSLTDALGKITAENLIAQLATALAPTTRWEPLTNGDPDAPELVFWNGDVIMVEVPI